MKIGVVYSFFAVILIWLIQAVRSSEVIKCPEFYKGLYKAEDIHTKFVSLFDEGRDVTFEKR